MKPQQFIQSPCEANWDAMTPQEGGRFCSLCTKKVVDFTEASTEEIISYLKQSSDRVCGRVKVEQVFMNKVKTLEHMYFKLYQYSTLTFKPYFYKKSLLFGASLFGILLGLQSCNSTPQESTVGKILQKNTFSLTPSCSPEQLGGMRTEVGEMVATPPPPLKMGELPAPQQIMGDIALPEPPPQVVPDPPEVLGKMIAPPSHSKPVTDSIQEPKIQGGMG